MNAIQQLLADHIDIWTAADTEKKSSRGRSASNAGSVFGIRKLRELILELAVRGKLVPQDAADEPASELLKRVQVEKAKLIADGKIRKDKTLPPITNEEKPFELPQGWKWVRLGDFVLSILSGGTPSKNNSEFWNGDIPWASVKDLNGNKFLDSTQDHITKEGLEAGSKLANKGDLLICTRMGLGKIAIATIDVAINQDLKALKITSQLDIDYFINFYGTLKIIGSGMTVAGIRQDELLGYCVPTPPLAEQHRIVAKVDEMMALCDQLETRHNTTTVAHEKLVSHLLGTLTQSQSAAEFSANWQRIAAHFDTLFTTEASIDALKQTLLQLAVMGKLVPQDPNDEPASELLKRIQDEKTNLIVHGLIKKEKPLALIADEDRPFDLPKNWVWARIGVFALNTDYGLSEQTFDTSNGVPVLKMGDIQNGKVILGGQKKVPKAVEGLPELYLKSGDILYNRTNSAELVGKTGIYEGPEGEYSFASYLIRIRCVESLSSSHYLNCVMNTPLFRKTQIDPHITQQCGQANVNGTIMKNMIVSIPPLKEQKLIVAKVNQLMALCDRIKARITEANQLQKKLADVMVEKAVA